MNLDYDKDNKERIPFEHYKGRFREADPYDISNRCKFPFDEENRFFQVRFLNQEYRVSYPEFQIEKVCDDEGYYILLESIPAQILLIHHMLEGRNIPSTGKYITYRDVPWGETYYQQFHGRCILRLAFGFGFKFEQFSKAMQALGAKKADMGDISYEFELLDGLSVIFILWAGDEEFSPSSQILFSDNFPSAFTAEDMAVVGDISIGALKILTK